MVITPKKGMDESVSPIHTLEKITGPVKDVSQELNSCESESKRDLMYKR